MNFIKRNILYIKISKGEISDFCLNSQISPWKLWYITVNQGVLPAKSKDGDKNDKRYKKVGEICKIHPGQGFYNFLTTTYVLIETRIDCCRR